MQVSYETDLGAACQDGTLLVHVYEHLERCKLPGIARKPRRPAAARFNVQSVLSRLRSNAAMPTEYLWSDQRIVAGDSAVAIGLLSHMQAAYGRKKGKACLPAAR